MRKSLQNTTDKMEVTFYQFDIDNSERQWVVRKEEVTVSENIRESHHCIRISKKILHCTYILEGSRYTR